MLKLGLQQCARSSLYQMRVSSTKQTSTILQVARPAVCFQLVRNANFFNRKNAEHLWKSVLTVSNAGRKRGRAANLKNKRKDFNKGQVYGIGKKNISWPGIHAPPTISAQKIEDYILPSDPERQNKIIKAREYYESLRKKKKKLTPLERGWSGTKLHGRKIGPPEPVDDEKFENFESIIIQYRIVICPRTKGKRRRANAMVVTGNQNGLAGFAARSAAQDVITIARSAAAKRLVYIKRDENDSVLHDFHTQFSNTKLFVTKVPEGFGLRCQRVIKACCETIGIRNLHVTLEGNKNPPNIVKAFFIGLLKQKTPEEIVEEKKLHLVECRSDRDYFPVVKATPKGGSSVRKDDDDVLVNEFNMYLYDGKVRLERLKSEIPKNYLAPSNIIHLRKSLYQRNFEQVKYQLRLEHGVCKSFLNERYPEVRKPKKAKKKEDSS